MKKLYVDFDGVLMDTITTSYKLLEDENIDRKNTDEVANFYRNLNWEEIIKITPILNDSMKRLTKIKESNKYEIIILTHINSLPEIGWKLNFVRKYFDDISVIGCPKEISKTNIVDPTDAILIDDWHMNLKEWQEAGGIAIKFSPTLNSRGYICINYLDQILEMDI